MNTLKARRRLSRSEGFALISDYLHSGMGCKEYYTSHEISEWQFYKWKRLYLLEHPQEPPSSRSIKETGPSQFSPLEVISPPPSMPSCLSLPSIEIRYPDGKSLRIAEGEIEILLLERLLSL